MSEVDAVTTYRQIISAASRQLLNITKAALDSAEQECLNIRNHTIEECAQRIDIYYRGTGNRTATEAASIIRAMKEKKP